MSTSVVEKKIPSGAIASHVLLAGDPKNPPAILLHGAGPGATAASNWLRCAPDLAKHYYVIAPDLVGFGQTDRQAPQGAAGDGIRCHLAREIGREDEGLDDGRKGAVGEVVQRPAAQQAGSGGQIRGRHAAVPAGVGSEANGAAIITPRPPDGAHDFLSVIRSFP